MILYNSELIQRGFVEHFKRAEFAVAREEEGLEVEFERRQRKISVSEIVTKCFSRL